MIETPEGPYGYGFAGDELVMAQGWSALEGVAARSGPRLADDPGYQRAVAALPAPNAGTMYITMTRVRTALAAAGEGGERLAVRLGLFQALFIAG